MQRRVFLSFLTLLTLVSCNANGASFGWKDNRSLIYLERNGDLSSRKEASSNTYQDVTRSVKGDDLIECTNNGISFALLLTQKSCSHCISLEPKFVSYMLDSETEFLMMDVGGGTGEITKYINAFPESNFSDVFQDLRTPSIYFINGTTASYVSIAVQTSTTAAFESYMAPKYNNSLVYHYRSCESFSKIKDEEKTILYFLGETNKEFYYSNLYDLSHHHNKRLNVVDWEYLSEDDQASFTSTYGENLLNNVFDMKKGEGHSLDGDALTFISSYYGN